MMGNIKKICDINIETKEEIFKIAKKINSLNMLKNFMHPNDVKIINSLKKIIMEEKGKLLVWCETLEEIEKELKNE